MSEIHSYDLPKENEKEKLIEEILAMRERIMRFLISEGCSEEDAKDITQNTLAKAVSAIDSFREESKLETWVFTIAKRLFIDLTRKPIYRREIPSGDTRNFIDYTGDSHENPDHPFKAFVSKTPSDIAVANERADLLKKAIDKLKEPYRSIMLARIEGDSHEEIAEKFNIPLGTSLSRAHTARQKLDEILELMGVKEDIKI